MEQTFYVLVLSLKVVSVQFSLKPLNPKPYDWGMEWVLGSRGADLRRLGGVSSGMDFSVDWLWVRLRV